MAVASFLKNRKGFSAIEIIVASALIAISFSSLIGIIVFSLKVMSLKREVLEANILAQSMIESVRSFRDHTEWSVDGLGNLSTGTEYYPVEAGGTWGLLEGRKTVDPLEGWVTIENGLRDGSDDIVESGGDVDLDTKKVTATVSWTTRDRELTVTTYLTNWKE